MVSSIGSRKRAINKRPTPRRAQLLAEAVRVSSLPPRDDRSRGELIRSAVPLAGILAGSRAQAECPVSLREFREGAAAALSSSTVALKRLRDVREPSNRRARGLGRVQARSPILGAERVHGAEARYERVLHV